MTKKKNTECPICNGEFTKVHMSHKVCESHSSQGWIVTVCPDCKQSRFSQTRGVCGSCLSNSPKNYVGGGFGKTHRGTLIRNGMGCKDNG